jgi:pSer/pThr/pTyr-binding forkhead associated (FHA) protein
MYEDAVGCRRCFELAERTSATLGRRPEADVCLPWDSGISRLHAELLLRAGEWLIADDGLSQNGTFVNGLPLEGRRRLRDGDLITIGSTSLTFCSSESDAADGADVTMSVPAMRSAWRYSEQQQLILRALCRPLWEDGEGVHPADDAEIAAALRLPERVVARELDDVAHSFDFAGLALEERRRRTALSAIRSGLVDNRD